MARVTRRWSGPVICVAVAIAGVLPGGAQAAKPFLLGYGVQASAVAGPDGVVHVAWTTKDQQAVSCRLPVGATGCDPLVYLPRADAGSGSEPTAWAGNATVTVSGETVEVVASSTCGREGITMWRSIDGGRSFEPRVPCVSTGIRSPPEIAAGQLVRGGDGLAVAPENRDASFGATVPGLHVFSDGVEQGDHRGVDLFTLNTPSSRVELLRTGTGAASSLVAGTVVASVAGPSTAIYSVFEGAFDPATAAQVLDPSRWTRDLVLASGGAQDQAGIPHFADGSAGLIVAYTVHQDRPYGERVQLRRFDDATRRFGPATELDLSPKGLGRSPFESMQRVTGLRQDGRGRLHLLLNVGAYLKDAVSSDRGRSFTVLGQVNSGVFGGANGFALAPDGSGTLVSAGAASPWIAGDAPPIAAVRIVPDAVAPTPPPATTSGGVTARPKAYAGALGTVSRSTRSFTLRLRSPKRCLRPGQAFTALLGVQRRRGAGKAIRRVAFRLGSATATNDRRAPFAARLRVPMSAKARAKLKLTAATTPRSASIRANLRVCG
jgi:hypothetical protein